LGADAPKVEANVAVPPGAALLYGPGGAGLKNVTPRLLVGL
jgi:hypothetical protein